MSTSQLYSPLWWCGRLLSVCEVCRGTYVDAVVAVTRLLLFVLHLCLLRECDGVRLTAMLVWWMDEVWWVQGMWVVHVVQVLCLAQLTYYGWVWCVGWEELVEYVRCVCVWLMAVWKVRGEWMIELGLGFTNPVGTGGGLLDVCRCFGCGGVGRGLEPGSGGVGWCYICASCESGICIGLGGYLRIWGAPSVQSCCTLWIYVS